MSDIAKAAGVSRQALYLHFKTRAELFIATTKFIDQELDSTNRLAPYFKATDPVEKIEIYVAAWAGHVEGIQDVARALLIASTTDSEAFEAWNDRMEAIHGQAKAMTKGLADAGRLKPGLSLKRAADLLAIVISFQNWDRLRNEYGWSKKAYIEHTIALIHSTFVSD